MGDPVSIGHAAVSNGIPPPGFDLPYPDRPELITANLLRLNELDPNARTKFVLGKLIHHLHHFIRETNITTEEWMKAIQFLTSVGQTCTNVRQEFILLSDILGVSALVDALNHPVVGGATESSVLGPFFTDDAPDVKQGDSIASEGKGEYLYVEGKILGTDGRRIPNAVIETWETDADGFYDTQHANRSIPDCRGRLRSDEDGKYAYRAVVPVPYPIPGDGPVGHLLTSIGRHNMRPAHLHLMVEAPGCKKLVTALYPEGDKWLASDVVFGVKKSLIVRLKEINDETEAQKRGFPKGVNFKLLEFDIVLMTEDEARTAKARSLNLLQSSG